jgi:hypothetical protein
MAYAAPPPAPRTRPGTVAVAVILLCVAAALEVINVIIAIATYGDFKNAYEKAYAGTSLQGQTGTATITVIVGVVIGLVLAAIFVVLAVLDNKGNRIGRILTWVFGGLALCCLGSSFALGALGKSAYDASRKTNPDLPSYDQFQNTINSELPSWYTPVTTTIGIVVLIAVVVVIILLALPASNGYFRKTETPQWEPPLPPTAAGGAYGATGYETPPPAGPPGYEQPPEPPRPAGPSGPPPSNWPPTS